MVPTTPWGTVRSPRPQTRVNGNFPFAHGHTPLAPCLPPASRTCFDGAPFGTACPRRRGRIPSGPLTSRDDRNTHHRRRGHPPRPPTATATATHPPPRAQIGGAQKHPPRGPPNVTPPGGCGPLRAAARRIAPRGALLPAERAPGSGVNGESLPLPARPPPPTLPCRAGAHRCRRHGPPRRWLWPSRSRPPWFVASPPPTAQSPHRPSPSSPSFTPPCLTLTSSRLSLCASPLFRPALTGTPVH